MNVDDTIRLMLVQDLYTPVEKIQFCLRHEHNSRVSKSDIEDIRSDFKSTIKLLRHIGLLDWGLFVGLVPGPGLKKPKIPKGEGVRRRRASRPQEWPG